MIQLATDPNASRSWHPAAHDDKRNAFSLQRRGGHAWPFLSRQAVQPAPQPISKPSSDSGS
ncbi:MAG: hypothetical protein EOO54_05450 [Haliea sp.]|nr:MAG: hypothetical protein EOO54_05450 [Haliea sp.]